MFDYWSQEPYVTILGTFLGALLGVLIALQLERWSEAKESRARTKDLVKLLRSTVNDNREIMAKITNDLSNPSAIQFIDIDTVILNSTAALKFECLPLNLCRQIDSLRYNLSVYNTKLHTLRDLAFNPTARGTNIKDSDTGESELYYKKMRNLIYESIKDQQNFLSSSFQSTLENLDAEDAKLSAKWTDRIKTIILTR